ncbi:MAG: MATE family efflux transporter [Bdellovibrionales bacterium]|nr:MATE family efflux transporter [Bdellovibrionales bacterium]
MSSLKRADALKQILIFAGPIIFGQIGLMLIGTGDMIIAGRYSRECLAAIGLAIAILNPIQISLLGMQFSIGPILAQMRGQGEDVSKTYWTIIAYSMMVSLGSCFLSLLTYFVVTWIDYGPELNRIIMVYILVTSFSTFGLGLYQGIKEFYQSQEKTMAANITALAAALFNVGINYALVFGAWGFPELEEAGLAWASLTCRIVMSLVLFFLSYKFWKTSRAIDWALIRKFSKVGAPVTASLFFEIMAFCSVTLFVGRFAEDQIAANNLALNIGSLAFMIPLSVSSAVSVKIGHAYGEKSYSAIRIFAQMSLLITFVFAVLMGLSFYLFPHAILSFYTSDVAVIEWGKKLLFWVACFQLFDGAQVTLSGILRGLSVTRPSSIAIFIGYWIIGIPLGYYLGFHTPLEAQGFWIGLAISLAVVALMLSVVMKNQMRKLLNGA